MYYHTSDPDSLKITPTSKDRVNKFISCVLDEQKWPKQIIKQYFDKRLTMTNEDEKKKSEFTNMLDMQWKNK